MDSSDKPTVLLEYYLKRLKLATMLKEYAVVAKLCGQERADYLNFLLRLVEREALRREQRAAERRIVAANFPVIRAVAPGSWTGKFSF
jgi:DNA replication protein DnaC